MATTDQAALSKVLKTIYPQKKCQSLLYENRPLLARLKKDEEFGGKERKISARIAPGKGRSSSFARAQANKGPSQYAQFTITLDDDYGLFSVTTKALRSARKDPWSLVTDIKRDGDAVMNALKNSISSAIYGNGGGAIGQIESGSTSETLTMTEGTNMHLFEVGMILVSDNTDGSAGGADDGERIEITAVDVSARTITKATGSDWDASGNFAANDYVFVDGDYGNKIKGLDAWLPATAPAVGGGDSFFGQDRSIAPSKLAGVRVVANGNDGDIANCLIRGSSEVFTNGGAPDSVYMNPLTWSKFVIQLENRVRFERMLARGAKGDIASVGFDAIKVMGAAGEMHVYADPFCPVNLAYMLSLDDWLLASLGPCPGWLDEDGAGNVLREPTADAYEGRLGAFFQMYTDAPGHNARIDLTAVIPQ